MSVASHWFRRCRRSRTVEWVAPRLPSDCVLHAWGCSRGGCLRVSIRPPSRVEGRFYRTRHMRL